MRAVLGKFRILLERELITWTKSRALFLSFFVGPVIWIFIFGTALNAAFFANGNTGANFQGAPDYFNFIASGMFVVIPITFAGRSGGSIFVDRLTGYLDRLLVSPVSRETIVLSKVVASVILGMVQATILLVATVLFGLRISALSVVPVLILGASVMMTAYGFSVAFTLLSMRIRRWPTQQLVASLLTTPIMFLSNAFYPSATIPPLLRDIMLLNPLSYAINVARSIFFESGFAFSSGLLFNLAVLSAFAGGASVALIVATRRWL